MAGIEPHEVQALLGEASLFSEDLWSKKDFLEGEKLFLERQQVSRFPAEERAISLKRAVTSTAGQPFQKKARPSLPPIQSTNPPTRGFLFPRAIRFKR